MLYLALEFQANAPGPKTTGSISQRPKRGAKSQDDGTQHGCSQPLEETSAEPAENPK